MINKYLKFHTYIKTLLENQSITNVEYLQNIFSKKDYINLLRPVLETIKENPYANLTTLRLKLFLKSGLKELTEDFVYKTKITPGILMDFGTIKNRDTILCGNMEEIPNQKPIEQDTIFDLASTSKLFTSISILKLLEAGLIDLYSPVTNYVKEFTKLGNITIYDLLKFRVNICTDKRVDSAKSPEEAEQILFTVHKNDNPNIYNAYTDMGAMVLRYVVEKVSNMSFNDFVKEIILKPLDMNDTYLHVPQEKLSRVANENYSSIIKKDGSDITKTDNIPGTPHDDKARVIGSTQNIAPGHAGYFSTKDDMIKLGTALANFTILNKYSVYSISDNATGQILEDGSYSRFYGSLVYLKQPDPKFLRVYPPLSGKSFMSPGFAGTTLVVDPLNKIVLFTGANRLHNRIYRIHPDQVKNIHTYSNGCQSFTLKNGEEKIISAPYTGKKEIIVKCALDLTLQYQLLEILYPSEKELKLVREL